MLYRKRWLWFVALITLVLTVSWSTLVVGQEEGPCTIHVKPGESIQAAIDGAEEGDIICLEEGTWLTNLEITKSLTIRGVGTSKTTIEGPSRSLATISVRSQAKNKAIFVRILGLSVHGEYEGIEVRDSAEAVITACSISDNYWGGITVSDRAQATIADCTIANHHDTGIAIAGAASARIIDCEVSGNHWGIFLNHSAHATILRVEIKNNHWGIWALGQAHAVIEDSDIFHNEYDGIRLQESGSINLTESRISTNHCYGIALHSPCYIQEENGFTGEVTGKGNFIPGPTQPNGNQEGSLCPSYPGEPWPEGFLKGEEYET